jgi:uncharacterized protein
MNAVAGARPAALARLASLSVRGSGAFAFLLCALALPLHAGAALAAPATEATIRELFQVEKKEQAVDGARGERDAMVDELMRKVQVGDTPNPKTEAASAHLRQRLIAFFDKQYAWAEIEPMKIKLYQDTFTEEEVRAMITFYKSPAGQAIIDKMPVLQRNAMAQRHARMQAWLPQLREIQQQFIQEIRGASK